jgi:citrate lyase subunit beta/citryl-CoA lyase
VLHPRDVLAGAQSTVGLLPVCDHYCGVEARMKKSLQLQAEMMEEFGACVFDVTLDCEDGAPVGGEIDQAQLVASLAVAAKHKPVHSGSAMARVGARLHPVDHDAFESDVQIIVGQAATALSYIMIPKVESLSDVQRAVAAVDGARASVPAEALPLHVLIESAGAVRNVFEIAAHPRVQSVSFGLMDFVSSHGGAIGSQAMGVRAESDFHSLDQFHHPLVVRAKLEISSACHAFGKAPSHCVVTEFRDTIALERAVRLASQALGYTRMWSIHPDQIRPILRAFSPAQDEVDMAVRIIEEALRKNWAPTSVDGKLHDRASYRFFWQLIERAFKTGRELPASMQMYLSADPQIH